MANMLYNGVELPDINEVWTDKTTYPYASILVTDTSTMGEGYKGFTASLYLFAEKPVAVPSSTGTSLVYSPSPIKETRLTNDSKFHQNYGSILNIGLNEWNTPTTVNSNIGTIALNTTWANFDLLKEDGSIVCAASEPVDPNAVSHVTTSSGNGFALYNGVKLPNIDSIVPDTSRAIISEIDISELEVDGHLYHLIDWLRVDIATDSLPTYICATSQIIVDILSEGGISVSLNTWTPDTDHIFGQGSTVWVGSDWNVGNYADYCTDPIPLDGMTVIEWDGVTDGNSIQLQAGYKIQRIGDYLPTNTYGGFVTSNTATDSNLITIYGSPSGSYSSIPDSYTAEASIFENDSWLVSYRGNELDLSFNALLSVNGSLPMSESITISDGLWAPVIGVNGNIAVYTPLVAYRTASDESNEPVITETSGDGFALYNGVKLPKLPERDKTTYPYAAIVDIGKLHSGVYILAFTAETADETLEYQGAWITYGIKNGVWIEQANNTDELDVGLSLGYTATKVVWSNYDILTAGGSIYLAASDPIPLDGMIVVEWNGGTAGLTNSGTGLYKITDDVFASNQVIGGVLVQNVSSKLTAIPITTAKVSAYENGISIDGKIYTSPANTLMPEAGTYFVKLVGDYVTLFAYPTSGGGGGGETTDLKPVYKRVGGVWVKKTAYEWQNGEWVLISTAT